MPDSLRFVIADDESHIRNLLEIMVSSIGYEVVGLAEDGKQALQMYTDLQPDVLLLDINMPNMSGVDVLHEVITMNPSAIVIMLTSLNSLDIVRQCLGGGAKQYILKDNSIDNMRTILEEAILKNITAELL
ncbi:MAG: response regulator [Thiotrichaceae bacterium]|nr:response regulator [Thiotrichaceae bacterium]PCI15150.1 MAG: two-component system response regulator [Thiotrichales bacterium]